MVAGEKIQPRLLRKREAAEYLAVSQRTINRMLSRREITPIKFGRQIRIDRLELDGKIEAAKQEIGHGLRFQANNN